MPENVEHICFMLKHKQCIRECWHCVEHQCPNQPNTQCNCAPGECGARDE